MFPTQIIDYYPDKADKEIAIFSVFIMNWDNGKELEQIAAVRKLMGEHPAMWFSYREFAPLSIGRLQNKSIDGYKDGKYWKLAKIYDMLFDLCFDGRDVRYPSKVFKKESFTDFCNEIAEVCQIKDMNYKRSVVEMVLRTSDGIGRGLWAVTPKKVKCPYTRPLMHYLRTWFPYWTCHMWSWDEAVRLFELEHDYDLFYAYFAHKELELIDAVGCRRYLQRYQYRWNEHQTYPGKYWLGVWRIAPIIDFDTKKENI